MIQLTRPENLGITRITAIAICVIALVASFIALVIAVAFQRVDAAVLVTFVTLFGTMITTLIAALKSTESADTSSKVLHTAELTASQNATIHQTLMAHCGDICPLEHCPLKGQLQTPIPLGVP